jgi:hypothetical protein
MLAFVEVRHLLGHVHVADLALGARQVLGRGVEVGDLVVQTVLDGAEVGALRGSWLMALST